MKRLGFSAKDFAVFRIDGFQPRMAALKARVRPKLMEIGKELAPALQEVSACEFHPHVAMHMRRTVHPPPETWVAFGASARGYKRFGHLALAISRHGLHARVVVKSEAGAREEMAGKFLDNAAALTRQLKATPLQWYAGWDLARFPDAADTNGALWEKCAAALKKKTGGIDLGLGWKGPQAAKLDLGALVECFENLMPLYRLTQV